MNNPEHTGDPERPRAGHAQRRPSLRRRLLRAGASSAGAKIAATVAMLINYRLIASRLPDEEVSAFLVVNGLAVLVAIVAGLGVGPLIVRRIRSAELAGDHTAAAAELRRGLVVTLASAAIASAAMLVTLVALPEAIGGQLAPHRWYAVGWMLGVVLCQFYGEAARGYERFGVAAMISNLNGGGLANVLLTLYLLSGVGGWESIEAVFVGQMIVLAVSVAVGWWLAGPIDGAASAEAAVVNRLDRPEEQRLTSILRESLPIVAAQLAVVGVVHFEMLLLAKYAPAQDVAAYGAVRRLMQLVGGPLLLLNAALPTFVVELFAQGQLEKLQRLLRSAATAAMAPAALLLLVMLVAPGWCLSLFNADYAAAWPALVVMALANLVFVYSGSCGLVLRMTGFEVAAMNSSLVTCGVYLVAAPWAAANYSLMGVAVAGALLIVARNVIGLLLVRRHVGVWSVPWLSPASIMSSLSMLRGGRPTGVAAGGAAAR